jgi:hypothetical protein
LALDFRNWQVLGALLLVIDRNMSPRNCIMMVDAVRMCRIEWGIADAS